LRFQALQNIRAEVLRLKWIARHPPGQKESDRYQDSNGEYSHEQALGDIPNHLYSSQKKKAPQKFPPASAFASVNIRSL
jgi:hypothetical protein